MYEERMHPRVTFDLQARLQVFGPGELINIAEGSEDFWQWYASTVRFNRPFRLSVRGDVPPYPPASGESAIWFSGGAESTYTFEKVRVRSPKILRIEDFSLFESEHRRFGQIHFLCAVTAAG